MFEYCGYHFIPYGKFPNDYNFMKICDCVYMGNNPPVLKTDEYDYNEFYKISKAKMYDIFWCRETNDFYVPYQEKLRLVETLFDGNKTETDKDEARLYMETILNKPDEEIQIINGEIKIIKCIKLNSGAKEETKQETYFDYYSKTPEKIAEFLILCDSACNHCLYKDQCDSQQSGLTCLNGVASWLKQPREKERFE